MRLSGSVEGRGRGLLLPSTGVPATAARRRLGPGERGAVTAETAVVMPVLVGLIIAMVWLLSLGVTQARVADAARETARALARDEQRTDAVELGSRVAPEGAVFTVREDATTVTVTVVAEVGGPGGLLGFVPGVEVESDAVAAKEQP